MPLSLRDGRSCNKFALRLTKKVTENQLQEVLKSAFGVVICVILLVVNAE